jgi:histidine ammonia-lyase
MNPIHIDSPGFSLGDLAALARSSVPAVLGGDARQRMQASRSLVEKWVAEEKVIYGITTGFGALSTKRISAADARTLQRNVIFSHAAGVGEPLADEVVRAAIALRLRDFALGHAGIRPLIADYLLDLLNHQMTPIVPSKGSVGASGDLAPMAHLCLVLLGRGHARHNGKTIGATQALKRIGRAPLVLEAGEGLALINGTPVMTAITALAVHDAAALCKIADIACAMSLEVLMGSRAEFDPRIHKVRPHAGQAAAAANMRKLTRLSPIIASHRGCSRVQDAYTLRCSPQIHGAVRQAVVHAHQVVTVEMNSSTTNPLIFPDSDEVLLGGNFHGQPVALAADYLTMAVAELGSVSERRVERMVNPQLSELPAFLVVNEGLNSGFMIAQYTAAALVSENKVLAHPASVDSIPTSANKEDHVSMGATAARKCRQVLENTVAVLSVELLCAAQAMDLVGLQKALAPGPGTGAAFAAIREKVAFLANDRVLAPDMEAVARLIRSGELVRRVEKAVGKLN